MSIDLTDERGNLAAFMLAGLGADVVLVEPPGGSAGRRRGPFAGDVDDGEHSLTFWGWNRGKRSVVLDLETADGQAALADAVRRRRRGDRVRRGARRPRRAACRRTRRSSRRRSRRSARPGRRRTGRRRTSRSTPPACQLAISGDDDRAPVRTAVPQSFLHACADAAAGVLVALTERATSGLGQHVEVSAQRSMMQATQSYALAVPLGGAAAQRTAGGVKTGGLDVRLLWPCKDGFASVTFLFGASIGPFTKRLMQWIYEEGYCDEATRDKDWLDYANLLYSGAEPIEEYDRLKRVVGDFCAVKTKAELLAAACERMLLIAPGRDARRRAAQRPVRGPRLHRRGRRRRAVAERPGARARARGCGRPPCRRSGSGGRRGSASTPPRCSARPGRPPSCRRPRRRVRAPLAGLKVLDLTWAMAGPATTRVMADFGADVVRVETSHHLDVARTIGPFVNDVPGNDSGGLLFNMTTGKRSISLDLRQPLAREVLDDLVRWSDVVIESFSPRGRAALDLEYERLAALRPGLVMMSSCLFGQSGPLRKYAGFGTMGASLGGFFDLTGWPDRPPCGPFGAYSDYPSPRFALCALLAALDHRRRTGEGQYLDFAQAEACVHFLSPAVLDQSVNGRATTRNGNADIAMVPHGVYPSAGDDAWVAIACRDDADWQALAALLDRADLAALTTTERRAREAELDGRRSALDRARAARRTRWPRRSPPACRPTRCRTPASA